MEEVDSYAATFSQNNLGASSIDAAAMSFLSILPKDAELILDIGSGPGLMSRRIPPFYKVLCMDLNEKILKSV
ncbi:class I SAM-dependent methyltransferase, partial [Acinetobacter baumannii]|uniref:class I SAM-dependent methyltransferase n=1 Tax=Acinetobacter baumannii TaxID=470 RepID=UPI001969CB18